MHNLEAVCEYLQLVSVPLLTSPSALCNHVLVGGHINPAISLAFLLAKKISAQRFFCYVCAQITGAITGSALVFAVCPLTPSNDVDNFDESSCGKLGKFPLCASYNVKQPDLHSNSAISAGCSPCSLLFFLRCMFSVRSVFCGSLAS